MSDPHLPAAVALEVDHVTVTYGAIRALDDVSIEAPRATITAGSSSILTPGASVPEGAPAFGPSFFSRAR